MDHYLFVIQMDMMYQECYFLVVVEQMVVDVNYFLNLVLSVIEQMIEEVLNLVTVVKTGD